MTATLLARDVAVTYGERTLFSGLDMVAPSQPSRAGIEKRHGSLGPSLSPGGRQDA